jgi:hypothetical protein
MSLIILIPAFNEAATVAGGGGGGGGPPPGRGVVGR